MKNINKSSLKKLVSCICIISILTCAMGCGSKEQADASADEKKVTGTKNIQFTTEAHTEDDMDDETMTDEESSSETDAETDGEEAGVTAGSGTGSSYEGSSYGESGSSGESAAGSGNDLTDSGSFNNSLYMDKVNAFKVAYQNNDTSGLGEWDAAAFPGIKACLDGAYGYSSSVDREKYVHDWICNHTVYDMDNYANGTIPYISYTYNGVFEKGVAVCGGYTSAFILIMNMMGIEAECQLGTVRGEGHSWAIVKLDDGEWYHVDLTWDDGDTIDYEYFNLTNAQLLDMRSFTPKRACNGTAYSYINYFMQDREHLIRNADDYKTFVTNLVKSGSTSSYVYITEDVASQCVQSYKYTYDTYAATGYGASVLIDGRGGNISIGDGIGRYYYRNIEVTYPKNFYVISSNEQLYEIVRNELLNGHSEICYVTASGYNIDTGIAYLTTKTEELWQHVPVKEEYYNSHVLVMQ